jgi:hypothetical protein
VLLASTQLTFARVVGGKRSGVANLAAHREGHSDCNGANCTTEFMPILECRWRCPDTAESSTASVAFAETDASGEYLNFVPDLENRARAVGVARRGAVQP